MTEASPTNLPKTIFNMIVLTSLSHLESCYIKPLQCPVCFWERIFYMHLGYYWDNKQSVWGKTAQPSKILYDIRDLFLCSAAWVNNKFIRWPNYSNSWSLFIIQARGCQRRSTDRKTCTTTRPKTKSHSSIFTLSHPRHTHMHTHTECFIRMAVQRLPLFPFMLSKTVNQRRCTK